MKSYRVGIVGYGNLGKAMVRLLHEKRDQLKAEGLDLLPVCVLPRKGGICVPDGLDLETLISYAEKKLPLDGFPGYDAELDFRKIVENRLIDILVEFTPTDKETGEPGLTHIRLALEHGIHVSTGNKGPILVAWRELSRLANERGLLLGVGCTTGGALPSVINGRESMAGSEIELIEGVLNGTTNFILDRMEETPGLAYAEALKEAQEAGIAETDPSMDVEGWDTAVKLTILAKVAMQADIELQDVSVVGITGVTPERVRDARNRGRKVKLIGRAWREDEAVRASVEPREIEATHPFYSVSAKNKGVRYVSDTLGDLLVVGGASGPVPAAASALRDIVNAWRNGLL